MAQGAKRVAAVVIGRNEGARLLACLRSLAGQVDRIVYVDSGSTDGSAEAARQCGVEVVALDMSLPFTAARARNAGLKHLADAPPSHVQFVDGDCEVAEGWIARAMEEFASRPAAVAVCGRRRERNPQASVFNRLADREWNTPVGQALACGGDVLMLHGAVTAVGGYRENLIAGEEPELCLRLRWAGGEIWRIDAEMTLHDAAMTRFSQWWRRSRRAGHAFAEGAFLHGAGPERHWVRETRRALIWGAGLPLAVLCAGLLHPVAFLLALVYPAQVIRLSARLGAETAVFAVLGKFAEAQGVIEFHLRRILGRRRGLIEYK